MPSSFPASGHSVQRLADISNDIVNIFDADGNAYKIFTDACSSELILAELSVGSGRRMAGQGFGVADIDQPQNHLKSVDKLGAGRSTSSLMPKLRIPEAFPPVIFWQGCPGICRRRGPRN